jgi:hypothetical protein
MIDVVVNNTYHAYHSASVVVAPSSRRSTCRLRNDGRKWIPGCPDRLDAASQSKLQERITAARIDRDIAEFFRAPDQLGAGNDEKLAMEDFQRQFVRDEDTFKVLNSPVPHVPSPYELIKKFYSGGGSAGGDNQGGRSIPL